MSSLYDLPLPEPAARPAPSAPAARPHLRAVPDVPLDFDAAVARLTPRLVRYATRRMGDPHEAEEIVQEALLRAFDHRHQLLTEDDVAAWTTVVTGRLVIDRLRVRGRYTSVADVPEGSRVGRDTADIVVARDEARTALDALDAMPARQAAVLWAREVEGQRYDEIGARFGMTEPAVRSILTRARRSLRKEYAARGGVVPAGGLAALAPWLGGMHWLGRVHRLTVKVAMPAVIGVVGSALLGAALLAPSSRGSGGSVRPLPATVVSASAASAADRLAAQPAGPARISTSTSRLVTTRPANSSGLLAQAPLNHTCASAAGAGAGSRSCTPGADVNGVYLRQTLPANPTGARAVGVGTGPVSCHHLPTNSVTTCSRPSTGVSR